MIPKLNIVLMGLASVVILGGAAALALQGMPNAKHEDIKQVRELVNQIVRPVTPAQEKDRAKQNLKKVLEEKQFPPEIRESALRYLEP